MKKIMVLLLIMFSFFSCYNFEDLPGSATAKYKYEVTGTSTSYSVTIQNTDDNTQQWSTVGNEWSYSWTQTGSRWLYIAAQNNKSSGNVTVKIYRDDIVIASNTSYGGYTIATIDGTY